MCIQTCQACGVCVHEECYGLDNSGELNTKWKCWPCRAVGTEIQGYQVRCHKLKTITQTTRPTECVLCAVNDGVHAMHALYNDHGEDARQLILPKGGTLPQRLAWVHTLCALTVCSHRGTQGSVYGCDKDGDYEGDGPIHHFAMCGLSKDSEEEDAEWVKMLNDHRSLICTICGKHETTAGRNLRVPLQCCAGDDEEYPEFKKHHRDIGEPCTQALHVGCAAWGFPNARPTCRRMWFYPGSTTEEGEFQDPVTEIFCDLHARQMNATALGIRGVPVKESSTGVLLKFTHEGGSTYGSPEPHAAAVLPSYTNPSVERRTHLKHTKGTSSSAGVDGGRDHGAKKKQGTVTSHTASLTRRSDVAKTLQSSKMKHSTASTGSKAKFTPAVPDSAFIPRKKATFSSGEPVAAPQKKTASLASKNLVSFKAPLHESGVASTQKPTNAPVAHSIPPLSGSITKNKSTTDKQSTQHSSDIVSSTLKRKQTELIKDYIEGRRHVNDSERAIHSISAPIRKRRRSISEEKQSDEERNARHESEQHDDIWINEDFESLLEKEELPPAGAPPDGVNPWAYLWEPGAKPFELEVIESAERRNMDDIS